MSFEEIKQLLQLGVIGFILVMVLRWIGKLIDKAVLDKENGMVAIGKRNNACLERQVDATTEYLEKEAKNSERTANAVARQTELCELHKEGLNIVQTNVGQVAALLENHNQISIKLHEEGLLVREELAEFRKEAQDPNAPFSTVETNQNIEKGLKVAEQACKGLRECVPFVPEDIAEVIKRNCTVIEEMLE